MTMPPRLKLIQVSKEYFQGKWQKVGFFENKGRVVDIRPMADLEAKNTKSQS